MELRRILALTDLSDRSGPGLALADAVAERFRCRVVVGLVHAPWPERAVESERQRARVEKHRAKEKAALERLAAGAIHAKRLEGTRDVIAASVREGVTRLIEECGPDAICLFPHGETAHRHVALGSIAEHVVRTARVPVLLARGRSFPPVDQPMRMMLAADLVEDPSISARSVGSLLGPRDELHLVHVIESYVYYPRSLGIRAALTPKEATDLRHRAAEALSAVTLGENVPEIGVHVVTGHPAETLVRVAAQVEADLLALHTHAARPFDPTRLGPVCESLVRRCPVTLLVLPKREPAAAGAGSA